MSKPDLPPCPCGRDPLRYAGIHGRRPAQVWCRGGGEAAHLPQHDIVVRAPKLVDAERLWRMLFTKGEKP